MLVARSRRRALERQVPQVAGSQLRRSPVTAGPHVRAPLPAHYVLRSAIRRPPAGCIVGDSTVVDGTDSPRVVARGGGLGVAGSLRWGIGAPLHSAYALRASHGPTHVSRRFAHKPGTEPRGLGLVASGGRGRPRLIVTARRLRETRRTVRWCDGRLATPHAQGWQHDPSSMCVAGVQLAWTHSVSQCQRGMHHTRWGCLPGAFGPARALIKCTRVGRRQAEEGLPAVGSRQGKGEALWRGVDQHQQRPRAQAGRWAARR